MPNFTRKHITLKKDQKQELYHACRTGNWDVWAKFEDSHDLDSIIGMRDVAGNCLLIAAEKKQLALSQMLYERFGPSITYQSFERLNVLMFALVNRQYDYIDWIRSVANEEAWNRLIQYPCYSAAILSGDVNLTALLRQCGAGPYKNSPQKYDPAYCAIQSGSREMMRETLLHNSNGGSQSLYRRLFQDYRRPIELFGKTVFFDREKLDLTLDTLIELKFWSTDDPYDKDRNPLYIIKNSHSDFSRELMITFLDMGMVYDLDTLHEHYRNGSMVEIVEAWEHLKRGNDEWIDIDLVVSKLRSIDRFNIDITIQDLLKRAEALRIDYAHDDVGWDCEPYRAIAPQRFVFA